MCSRQEDKRFWREFIKMYRDNPCLWKHTCMEYLDKHKRNKAYSILADKLREKDPGVNEMDVKKKINNLRCAFSKEYKRHAASLQAGDTGDDVYWPNLWYFEDMLFLKDVEMVPQDPDSTTPSTSNHLHSGCDKKDPEIAPYVLAERLYGEAEKLAPYVETEMNNEREFSPSMNPAPSSSNYDSVSQEPQRSSPPKKVKKSLLHNESNRILTMIGERISNSRVEDEWDSMGKVVAAKLRKLPPAQQIFAEKIIHEVLYEGQRGTLSNMAKLCSIDHHHYSN